MTEAAVRRRYAEVADDYTRMFGTVASVHPDDLRFLERNFTRCDGTILGPGRLFYLDGLLGFDSADPHLSVCAEAGK